MHPILTNIPVAGASVPIGSYALCLLLAATVGWLICARLGRDVAGAGAWFEFCFGALVGGLLGAKLMQFAVDLAAGVPAAAAASGAFFAGGVWLGGVIGVTIISALFARRCGIGFPTLAGIALVALPFAHAIGRIGCLLAGCCYGAPTDLPWAITYGSPLAAEISGTPLGQPLHPSPLYEAGLELANGCLLLALYRRGFTRMALGLWPLLYGIERFLFEFLRGDPRGEFALLTTSQWLALGLMALGLAVLLKGRLRPVLATALLATPAANAGTMNQATGAFDDGGPGLVAQGATDVVLADFDLDGDLDAVVTFGYRTDPGPVFTPLPNRIFRNDAGVLTEVGSFGTEVSDSIAAGDVNGDNYPDLIVAGGYLPDFSGGSTADHRVWLNNGPGPIGFSAGAMLATGSTTSGMHVAMADVDSDGDLDLVMTTDSDTVSVYANQGGLQAGTLGDFAFATGFNLAGGSIVDLELGELNGQPGVDLYVAVGGADDEIYFNDGAGGFTASTQTIPGDARQAAALGDVDGDTDLDLVLGDGNAVGSERLSVWYNDGTGQFAQSSQRFEQGDTAALALADLDGNGSLDAFVGSRGRGQASNHVWLNDGAGALNQTAQCFGKHEGTVAVALGDVDGDLAVDAFAAAIPVLDGAFQPLSGQSGTSVWLNGSTSPVQCCPFEILDVATVILDDAKRRLAGGIEVLGGAVQPVVDLALLYRVRDEIMAPRLDGARFVDHYEAFGPEIVAIFLADPDFHYQALNAYRFWQDALQAQVDGQGGSVNITAAMAQRLDDFLTGVSTRGSAALAQMIADERASLPAFSSFAGQTMDQFTAQTMGPIETLFEDGFETNP